MVFVHDARTPQVTEPVTPMTRPSAERVAAIRRYRGMTQDELAEAMRDLGIPWQRVVVAKLESGRRSYLTVDELLAICVILEITPTDLLVPRELKDDQDYLVAPKATARAVDTREWVRGSGLLFWRPYPEPDRVHPVRLSDRQDLRPHPMDAADRAERVARRYQDIEEEETSEQIPLSPLRLPGRERQAIRHQVPQAEEQPEARHLGLLPECRHRPEDRQRRQFRKAGFATKGAAASALAELKTKLDKGTYVKPSNEDARRVRPEVAPPS